MVRTQIYLTLEEQLALRSISEQRGRTQSDLIREAIDGFVARFRRSSRVELLRAGKGLWQDREDFDLAAVRGELDRRLEA